MAAVLLLTAGCSLIVKNEEVDRQTVIVDVLGKTLIKGDLMADYEAQLAVQTGNGYDMTMSDNQNALKDSIINSFIQNTVLEQKLQENGLETLSEEDKTAAMSSAQENYDYYVNLIKMYYFSGSELAEEELNKAVNDQMAAMGLGTLESMQENSIQAKKYSLLQDKLTTDVTVSDDEIKTEYDTRVNNATETYLATPVQYDTDVSNGTTVYYKPAGYRYIKNLLVKIDDTASSEIADLNSQISAKTSELATAQTTIADYEDDTQEQIDALDEAAKAARDESYEAAKTSRDTLDKEIADLNVQLTTKTKAAFSAISPTIEEIKGKLAAGESFDALLETYGQDEGMKASPTKETGYLVCDGMTKYVAAFTEAAMKLAKVGDISEPVETSYGYHLLQYASDLAQGAVPMDELKDTLQAELLQTKKSEAFNALVEQWVADANAKIDRNALK